MSENPAIHLYLVGGSHSILTKLKSNVQDQPVTIMVNECKCIDKMANADCIEDDHHEDLWTDFYVVCESGVKCIGETVGNIREKNQAAKVYVLLKNSENVKLIKSLVRLGVDGILSEKELDVAPIVQDASDRLRAKRKFKTLSTRLDSLKLTTSFLAASFI